MAPVKPESWETPFGPVKVSPRSPQGPAVQGSSAEALFFALGRLHAQDRRRQILLGRALLKGQLSHFFKDAPGVRDSDRFNQSFFPTAALEAEVASLDVGGRALALAYVNGVNVGLFPKRRPWDGLWHPEAEKWTLEDSLLIARCLGVTSALETTLPVYRLLAELVRTHTPWPLIRELFPELPQMPEASAWAAVTRQLDLSAEAWDLQGLLPRWRTGAVFGVDATFSASGSPLLAGALVTEVSSWPSPFYEVGLDGPDGPSRGLSLPGMPGFLAGRTARLGWALAPVAGDNFDLSLAAEPGRSWPGTTVGVAWVGARAAGTLNALLALFRAETAAEAQTWLQGRGSASLDGLVADRVAVKAVRLGCQWRRPGSLSPWPVTVQKPAFVERAPTSTLAATDGRWLAANPPPWKFPARERLFQLLLERTRFRESDLQAILRDDFSYQGQKLRTEVRFLFPPTELGGLLRNWSCRANEAGAQEFENLQRALIQGIFAPLETDSELWPDIHGESVLYNNEGHRFDRVLFQADSAWYRGRERDEVLAQISKEFFRLATRSPAPTLSIWPQAHQGKASFFKHLEPQPCVPGRGLVVRRQKELVGTRLRAFGPAALFTCDLGGVGFSTCSLSTPTEEPSAVDDQPDWAAWLSSQFKKL